jgi:hypothetical protein
MSMSKTTRALHRSMSACFTITVLTYIVTAMLHPGTQPPPWITYAPLLPLAVLFFTGIYLFLLPYLSRKG